MGRFRDLTGERFGRLLVEGTSGYNKHHQLYWKCECECGNYKEVLGSLLRNGMTQSCGCLQKEAAAKINYKHGMAKTPIFNIWWSMMQRCYDKNSQAYNRYGGRGINVCDQWQQFEGFYAAMGDKPKDMSLDRIDNNGDYSPENVKWANAKTQANNRKSNVVLEHNGKKQTMQQWSDELGLKVGTVWARLNRGWNISQALTKGVSHA
jgi:hypothetical protein